jgi:hypothetical protein
MLKLGASLPPGLWTLDSGLWTLDSGLWTLDSGLWTLDSGLWTLDPGPRTPPAGDSIRVMKRHLACLVPTAIAMVVAAAALSASAEMAAGASGVITKGGRTLKVVDAFAFEGVGQFGDPVIRIRLSGRALNQKALAAVIDTGFELDDQRAGAGYVDFFVDKTTGAYQGTTYDLGASVSCAFCMNPEVFEGSKLRIEAGHVRGAVKVAAGSYDSGKGMGINITLDVPIAVPAPLAPLAGAAASAETKAFQACRASVAQRDETAIAKCFSPDNPAMRSTKADASLFWTMLRAYDPVWDMATLTVTAGRTRGEWVELSINGVAGGSQAKGVVYLRRMADGIKYSHSVID